LTTIEEHGQAVRDFFYDEPTTIIPCIPGTKRPVLKWQKEYRWQDRPQSEDEWGWIRRRYARYWFATPCRQGIGTFEADTAEGDRQLDAFLRERGILLRTTIRGRRFPHRSFSADEHFRGHALKDDAGRAFAELKGHGQLIALSGKTILRPNLFPEAPEALNEYLRSLEAVRTHSSANKIDRRRADIPSREVSPVTGRLEAHLPRRDMRSRCLFSIDDLQEIPLGKTRIQALWSVEEVRDRIAAWLGLTYGKGVLCPLHNERHPSAALYYDEQGGYVWLHDFHHRDGRTGVSIGELDIYQRTGTLVKLPRVSQATFTLKVFADLDIIEPVDLPLCCVLPETVPPYVTKVFEMFRYKQAVRWTCYPPTATPYTRWFVQQWTGLSEWKARTALDYLTSNRYLVEVERDKKTGAPLFVYRQGGH